MVKIIKEGKKTFETTCSRCGCVFSYQLCDLDVALKRYLYCPCCNNQVYHKDQSSAGITYDESTKDMRSISLNEVLKDET